MARPPAKELTERELEVMHVFWERGNATVAESAMPWQTRGSTAPIRRSRPWFGSWRIRGSSIRPTRSARSRINRADHTRTSRGNCWAS